MADNVVITPGTGATVAADERTINSTAVLVQRVDEQGSTAVLTDQLSITTTATSATIAARETRKTLTLINRSTGSTTLYWSHQATNAGASSTDNSVSLLVGESIEIHTTAAIYVFTATGTGTLHYVEEFDN